MTISAIFAVDNSGGMGLNGSLPWPHNAPDLANFQRLTKDNVIVMGRKTWDDPKMPKPLKGRIAYVASHSYAPYAITFQGDLVTKLLELEKVHSGRNIFVIGGPGLIEAAKPVLDRIYLTHFRDSYKVDTRIHLGEFLKGFKPIRAQVNSDFQSTLITYAPIFNRTSTCS
ncbi:MAG TPA: dihydrofolate reductase [Methanosarcina sp.]|nr:dihydrofolate reductase [Methanosarcina sp.]